MAEEKSDTLADEATLGLPDQVKVAVFRHLPVD
jgi:hypothetical protein